SDDSITFNSADDSLTDGARMRLSDLANRLMSDNQNVYVEIQGYTDATGSAAYNHQLGLARAESVRRYLHSQGVALDRMATISYGEAYQAADNDSPEVHAMYRRVETVVMQLSLVADLRNDCRAVLSALFYLHILSLTPACRS